MNKGREPYTVNRCPKLPDEQIHAVASCGAGSSPGSRAGNRWDHAGSRWGRAGSRWRHAGNRWDHAGNRWGRADR